jgi:hypothetical protein
MPRTARPVIAPGPGTRYPRPHMRECAACGGSVEREYRFCPWCAAPQRLKVVEFFRPHPQIEHDRSKALRVSRYLGGSVDERHVRFSVWEETTSTARVAGAVSLDEAEAERLARFLAEPPGAEAPTDTLADTIV